MQSYILYYVTLLSILVKSSQPACTTKPNSGIITALLPLHTGTDCTTVNLRGIQQAGALQATINSINPDLRKESNIIINLKIHDTCSNEDGAVKAALKAMVESDQTCLHPPLFMGFIGPEDKEILDAVQLVTRLFNGTHIIPYSHDLTGTADESTFHVTTKQSQNQAQSIITILHQMKWTTFSLAVDSSVINQNLAKNILELVAEDPTLCIVDNIARFSDDASIRNTLSGSSGHGVVFLADSAETAKNVLQGNQISPKPMVLFINKVGLQSWQIPAVNSTLAILQETIPAEIEGISEAMNASMYSTYLRQQDTDCKNVGDATACMQNKVQDVLQGSFDSSLLPLSYAARLMASSLLAAHKIKCRVAGSEGPTPGLCSRLSRIPSAEWRTFLQKSTATVKQNTNTNLPSVIRFKTEIPSSVDVYIRNQFSLSLEKIGQISNENQLELLTDYSFPPTDDTNVKIKVCPVDKLQQMIPTLRTSAPKGTPAVLSEPVDKHSENEFYDMVMLLCGAGLGILVFFILMTYIVYSSFKVKTEKQSTGGSPTIQRRPSRIARWRRGSGQSSRASIRTID